MKLSFRFLSLMLALVLGAPSLAHAANTGGPTVVDLSQEPKAPANTGTTVLEDTQRYGVWIKGDNVRAEIRVNDIPVYFKILRNDEVLDGTFNEWIKRGLNVVEIRMERFDDKRPYDVNFNIYYQSPTQIVNNEKTVLSTSRDEILLPYRQPVGIRTQSVPDLRVWQAEEVVLNDDEKARLTETINAQRSRLIDALVNADNSYLATFEKPLRDQLALAYGRIPEDDGKILERRKKLVEQFDTLNNAGIESTPELAVTDMTFDVMGDGKLVRISRVDGSPLIQVKRGTLVYTIDRPVYGSLGGVWERLR